MEEALWLQQREMGPWRDEGREGSELSAHRGFWHFRNPGGQGIPSTGRQSEKRTEKADGGAAAGIPGTVSASGGYRTADWRGIRLSQ